MSVAAKAELTKQLAALLGFEDGIADVLEMLLTIETKDDLKVYLDQLLGTDKDMLPFIEDVERVKQGGLPLNSAPQNGNKPSTPTAPHQHKNVPSGNHQNTKPVSKSFTTPKSQQIRGHIRGNVWDKQQQVKSAPTGRKNKNKMDSNNTAPTYQQATPTTERKDPPQYTSRIAQLEEKAPKVVAPAHGTPTVICGCFGTLHRPLTNCLYCGRISCEREGYSYCGFCGYLVEKSEGTSSDAAWKHKERLLRYDRESAQRTVIIDDQADYYSSSAWLTTTEEEEAKEMDQLRYDETHRHGRTMKLSLS